MSWCIQRERHTVCSFPCVCRIAPPTSTHRHGTMPRCWVETARHERETSEIAFTRRQTQVGHRLNYSTVREQRRRTSIRHYHRFALLFLSMACHCKSEQVTIFICSTYTPYIHNTWETLDPLYCSAGSKCSGVAKTRTSSTRKVCGGLGGEE